MLRPPVLVASFAAVAVAAAVAQPPAGTPDRVYFRDKADRAAPPKFLDGELKASAAGFVVSAGGKSTVVSPADIVRVVPGEVPGIDRKDLLDLAGLEEKRDWAKARDGYAGLQAKAKGAPDKARRFVDYKLAVATARAADDAADEAVGKEQAGAAAKLLEQFAAAFPGGWEGWPVARALSRLQLELGRPADAAKTWARAGKAADLPAELKAEAGFQEVDSLVRAKEWAAAAARADELLATAPPGPPRDRLALLRLAADGAKDPLAAAGAVEAEVAKAKDPSVRAAGYAAAAELYRAADKPRDAMWSLLWVEVVYNQDREEVAKAVARLAEVFRAQGDDDRAKAYQDRLRRLKAGL